MSSRLSPAGTNTNFAQYKTTTGWAMPTGDWTIGIWDNPAALSAGTVFSKGGLTSNGSFNLILVASGYRVGALDDSGNPLFLGGTLDGIAGATTLRYNAHPDAAFSPRLHIIRRRSGFSEYLVAEAGGAPVLVASDQVTFTTSALGNWSLGGTAGVANYEADIEGFFWASAAVTNADIALMAAGYKPTSVASISSALQVYYPIESSVLTDTANPAAAMTNLGSLSSVVMRRYGAVSTFADGPMLRGATALNMAAGTTTEPTNVVAITPFQWWQVIRHLNGSATLTLNGFDYGSGAADVEVRFIDPDNATATGWTIIAPNSSGGGAAISASLTVPKGYWKNIEAKRINSAGAGDSSRGNRSWVKWAVGEVVAIWGDSYQGQMDGVSRDGILAPNGYTSKVGTSTSDASIIRNQWNHYRGTTGAISGATGENQLANNLSAASQCCVGIQSYWGGATLIANWNGRLSSTPYLAAKAYSDLNGGLNRPNIVTWVSNRQNAQDIATSDALYSDYALFKTVLDGYLGAGTYQFVCMDTPPCMAPDSTGQGTLARSNMHVTRVATKKWCDDNPAVGVFVGAAFGYTTGDGVHPDDTARIGQIDPLWGNVGLWLRGGAGAIDPAGPYISGFVRSGADLIATVAGLGAGRSLLLKSGAQISGVLVSADNFATTLPLSSVTIQGTNQIKITPASAWPTSQLRLRYIYGAPGIKTGGSPDGFVEAGTNNVLYSDATILGVQPMVVQPIRGDAASYYSLAEPAAAVVPAQYYLQGTSRKGKGALRLTPAGKFVPVVGMLMALALSGSPGNVDAGPTVTPPTYTTVFAEDYEGGALTAVESNGATWSRANSITNPITGTRSYVFGVSAVAAGQFAEPYINFTAVAYQRYRLTVSLRNATPMQVVFGVRQRADPYLWIAQLTVAVNATTQTKSIEFVYPIADTAAAMRISTSLQTFSGLQIDEWQLQAVTWDGMALSPEPISDKLLGYHINQNPNNSGAALPAEVLRLWDSGTTWINMSSSSGGAPYNYTRFDAFADVAEAKGADLLYCFGAIPTAVSANPTSDDPYGPGSAGPISDVSAAVAFVTALLDHAPGRIKHFELFNEADGGQFWKGTPTQLVELAAALSPVLRARGVTVIGPNCTASGMKLFEALLALGIDAYCDAYSYHNYMAQGDRQAMAVAWNYRQMLTQRGITKPLYMTEGALPDATPGVLTRQVIVQAIQGVKSICYYTLEGIWGTPGAALGVPPTYATNSATGDEFANVAAWLAGTSPRACSYDPATGVSRVLVRKPDTTPRMFAWSDTPQSVTLTGTAGLAMIAAKTITGASSALTRDGAGDIVIALSTSPLMLE